MATTQMVFNTPPNWPATPDGWTPPQGWGPNPAWGPPPHGWPLWIEAKAPDQPWDSTSQRERPAPATVGGRPWYEKKRFIIPLVLLALVILGAIGDDGDGPAVADPAPTAASAVASDTRAPRVREEQEATREDPADDAAEAEPVEPAEPRQAAPAESADAYGDQPPGQSDFVAAVVTAQAEAREADNDLQKGGAKATRDQAICALPQAVEGWTGVVTTIDANSEGLGILAIEIADDVNVKTWNNALSDFMDDTLIDPSSPVFASALALKRGDVIRFSGTFVEDSSEGECIREASLSLNGKLTKPSFIFRFSEVSPG
jgi:hypothetical protein